MCPPSPVGSLMGSLYLVYSVTLSDDGSYRQTLKRCVNNHDYELERCTGLISVIVSELFWIN
jgi:hypothetical protein